MKLAAKYAALQKARNKKSNLERQIEMFSNSLTNITADIEKSEEDVAKIQLLLGELETLEKRKAKNSEEMTALFGSFNTEDPQQAYKYTDGYKRFEVLNAETSHLNIRIAEIPKEINKVYYRR